MSLRLWLHINSLFRVTRTFPFVLSLSKDGRESPSIHRAKPFMRRPSSARTVWQEKSFREVIFSQILNSPQTLPHRIKFYLYPLACLLTLPVLAAPSVSITVTAPVASAGADANLARIYSTQPWLPCTKTNQSFGLAKANKVKPAATTLPSDQLNFEITVVNEDNLTASGAAASDGIMDNHLYVFLVNPNANGSNSQFQQAWLAGGSDAVFPYAQIWVVTNPAFNDNPASLQPYSNITEVDPAKAIYKPADSFLGSEFSTTLFGAPMLFDKAARGKRLPQGPWLITAFLVNANRAVTLSSAEIQNPQYWEAWDAKPFILGTPFFKPNTGSGRGPVKGACH